MPDTNDESQSLNLGYTAREIREGASARAELGGKGMSAAAQTPRPATPPPAPVDRGGAKRPEKS